MDPPRAGSSEGFERGSDDPSENRLCILNPGDAGAGCSDSGEKRIPCKRGVAGGYVPLVGRCGGGMLFCFEGADEGKPMKILITGFVLGGETVNPAYEAVKLAGAHRLKIVKVEIPTQFETWRFWSGSSGLPRRGNQRRTGGGRAEITGGASASGGCADLRQRGKQAEARTACCTGPAAHFSTLPLKEIVKNAARQPDSVPDFQFCGKRTVTASHPGRSVWRLAAGISCGLSMCLTRRNSPDAGMALADTARGLCAAVEAVVNIWGHDKKRG